MDDRQVNISQSDSNTTTDNFTTNNIMDTMEEQQNIRQSMEEDPIPTDPPPPYESPKKNEVVWDTRPVRIYVIFITDDELSWFVY